MSQMPERLSITFIRSPASHSSTFAQEERFQAGMKAQEGYISIAFGTDPKGEKLRSSNFSAGIFDEQFEALARIMMQANSEYAIRAFGSAIKDFGQTTSPR